MSSTIVRFTDNGNFNHPTETNNHAANGLTRTFTCTVALLKKPFSNAYKFMSENIPKPNFISSISSNSAIDNNASNKEMSLNNTSNINPNEPERVLEDSNNHGESRGIKSTFANMLGLLTGSFIRLNNRIRQQNASIPSKNSSTSNPLNDNSNQPTESTFDQANDQYTVIDIDKDKIAEYIREVKYEALNPTLEEKKHVKKMIFLSENPDLEVKEYLEENKDLKKEINEQKEEVDLLNGEYNKLLERYKFKAEMLENAIKDGTVKIGTIFVDIVKNLEKKKDDAKDKLEKAESRLRELQSDYKRNEWKQLLILAYSCPDKGAWEKIQAEFSGTYADFTEEADTPLNIEKDTSIDEVQKFPDMSIWRIDTSKNRNLSSKTIASNNNSRDSDNIKF